MPLLWITLLSPIVLLLLMMAMERVETGLQEREPQGHAAE